jgi:hypothetical protein
MLAQKPLSRHHDEIVNLILQDCVSLSRQMKIENLRHAAAADP